MSPVVAGLGIGAGVTLIVRGLRPPPTSLRRIVRRFDAPGDTVAARRNRRSTRSRGRWLQRAALRSRDRAATVVAGGFGRRTRADLEIMDIAAEQFALHKLANAVAASAVMVVTWLLLGGAPTAAFAGLVAVTGLAYVIPDARLRRRAAMRRNDMRDGLARYLDLVDILLAGGAGLETAMDAAAGAGDGWAFRQIRESLERARATRRAAFAALESLGRRTGVDELIELSGSIRLAGEHGARIKQSIASRAASLRAGRLAQVEADANAATERMGLPTVVMFVGFMVLIGYPALQQISLAL